MIRRIPRRRGLHFLARLNDPDVDIDDIEGLVRQDPRISIKLLRYINSAAVGLRRRVESIREAVVLVGLCRIRAWANLVVMGGMTHKPKELLTLSLVRANLCERLALASGSNQPPLPFGTGIAQRRRRNDAPYRMAV